MDQSKVARSYLPPTLAADPQASSCPSCWAPHRSTPPSCLIIPYCHLAVGNCRASSFSSVALVPPGHWLTQQQATLLCQLRMPCMLRDALHVMLCFGRSAGTLGPAGTPGGRGARGGAALQPCSRTCHGVATPARCISCVVVPGVPWSDGQDLPLWHGKAFVLPVPTRTPTSVWRCSTTRLESAATSQAMETTMWGGGGLQYITHMMLPYTVILYGRSATKSQRHNVHK